MSPYPGQRGEASSCQDECTIVPAHLSLQRMDWESPSSRFNDSVLKRKTSICEVSEFLNSPSPAPKKKRVEEDLTVGNGVGDDSEDDQGDDLSDNKNEVS